MLWTGVGPFAHAMKITQEEPVRKPKKSVAGAKGTAKLGSKINDSDSYFKMEAIKIPKALQELLLSLSSLPKEKNSVEDTFLSQDVPQSPTCAKWAGNGITYANFVDCFPGVLEVLVTLLTRDDNPRLQLRALQALEDLVATPNDANEIRARVVYCAGALTGLLVLLANDNNPCFQVRSALIIRHLANGNYKTKTKICNHPGALHGLVVSLTKDSNPSLQQHTAKTLSTLATGQYSFESKIVLRFILEGLVTPFRNGTDSVHLSLKTMASWNSATDSGVLKGCKKNKDTPISIDLTEMQLRMQKLQMQIPSIGELFEGLSTFFEDFEETQIGQEIQDGCIGCMEYGEGKPRNGGCCSFYSWIWPACLLSKGKGVALLWDGHNDDTGDDASRELLLRRKPDVPLQVLLMSLSQVVEGKGIHQQRKALEDLCDQTQEALDDQTFSFLAQRPAKALKGLVSLLANPSLRALAISALKNLAASNQEIMATTVELLVSLGTFTNPLQEGAVWGLGGLITDSDDIKAKIVNRPGALTSLVALLGKDTSCRIRGTAAVVLRNLAAATDGETKTTLCNYPGALDGLVDALKIDEETIGLSCTISFGLQRNAALALGNLACGNQCGKIKAAIVNHPGALSGLVTALTNHWSPALQQNAAFALGNLASGDEQTKGKIMDHPGALVGLTLALSKNRHRSPAMQQHAAFAFGNLAGGDRAMKLTIVDHPLTLHSLIVSLSANSNPALQKNAAWALNILATGESETKSKIVYHEEVIQGLELASRDHDNVGMRRHLKWASRNLGANDDMETMEETNICRRLSEKFSCASLCPSG